MSVKELATPELVNTIGWMGWAPLHKGMLFFDLIIGTLTRAVPSND